MKTIGDRIKEQRILMGITQEELGRIASVSKVTIHKYETNVITNIPSDRIEIIAKALNVKPAYLMGWSDEDLEQKDKDNIQKIFSNNLKDLLEKSDKTQLELAKFLGVSNTTVNNYVKGYNMPRMDKIDKICQFFSVRRSDLIEKTNQEDYSEDTIVLARKLGTLDESQIQLINQMIDQFERNKDKDHE